MRPRPLPFALIGAGGGALGMWVEAPTTVVLLVAFLVSVRVSIRFWQVPRR